MLFRIIASQPRGIEKAVRATMAAEGLLEATDLERWVLSNPELLSATPDQGRPPLILGARPRGVADHLIPDILAVDPDGTFVICELKRSDDDASETLLSHPFSIQ